MTTIDEIITAAADRDCRMVSNSMIRQLCEEIVDLRSVLMSAKNEIERIRNEVREELKELHAKIEDLTICLQQAIGMAQDGVVPRDETSNRWRKSMRWHKV